MLNIFRLITEAHILKTFSICPALLYICKATAKRSQMKVSIHASCAQSLCTEGTVPNLRFKAGAD